MPLTQLPLAAKAIEELAEDAPVRRNIAEAAQRKTKIQDISEQALAHAIAPNNIVDTSTFGGFQPLFSSILTRSDDGIPPSSPTGVSAVALIGTLAIQWTPPSAEEWVKTATVRLTPDGGSPQTYQTTNLSGITIQNLEGNKDHAIEVMFTDAFALNSEWSTAIHETPLPTAIEDIDLTELSILGKLHGLLPNTNLATIEDYTKLAAELVQESHLATDSVSTPKIQADAIISDLIAAGAVLAEAMAVQDAAAINLWVQNGAIESAKIASLTADKITAGTISAVTIFVGAALQLASGGYLQAGSGTKLDTNGLHLVPDSSVNVLSYVLNKKVSGDNIGGGLGFFSGVTLNFLSDGTSATFKGGVFGADGAGGTRGSIYLYGSLAGNWSAFSTAYIALLSRSPSGEVRMGQKVYVEELLQAPTINATNTLSAENFQGWSVSNLIASKVSGPTYTSGAGGIALLTHNLFRVPQWVAIQVSTDGANYREADSSLGFNILINTTQVSVGNNTGSDHWIKISAM